MARMIPSTLSPEVKSSAEHRIFKWFKNAPHTEDWVVLHSLGIANHTRLIHGETDFFAIVPNKGIFALEIKGGRVSRKEGVWCFTNKYGRTETKSRGPFDQAWDGAHSIIKDIKSKIDMAHNHIGGVFFGIGVMFPDIEYFASGCDEEQWQVFDCRDGNDVKTYIDRLYINSCKKWEEKYGTYTLRNRFPTKEDVKYIASLLRGDFDKIVPLRMKIKFAEEQLITLTKEQYKCLDQLEDNFRCLIRGGAGTGKTLLAIEEAKRSALAGEKVALFCFNRNLGEWLEKCCESFPDECKPAYVGTLHRFMMQALSREDKTVITLGDSEENVEFFTHELPNKLIELMATKEAMFDKLIIDETQDLFIDEYIAVFDSILKSGFERGRWSLFGDFSSQAIYQSNLTEKSVINKLEEITSFIRFRLTVNCRNTKAIFEEIITVTGHNVSNNIWNKVEGPPVNYITYSSLEEQKERLEKVLTDLLENRIQQRNITILSPVKRESSVVSTLDRFAISDFKTNTPDKITFSTIHSYKGLENTIIILTDINSLTQVQLMYVGLSRARSGLFILESDVAAREYLELQKRRFLQ